MMRKRAALVLAMALAAFMLMGSNCGQSEPAPHQEGGHQQAPAPNPDPATRRGMGNVSITLWFTQDQAQTVVFFDFGQGKQSHKGNAPGGKWDAIVPVGQSVYALVSPFVPGERGRIHVTVVNNANGTKICEDSNDDTGHNGGANCGGVALV